jgi:hypothetical protein
MMALCEVAHTSASSAKDIVKTTDIWVVEDEDAVVTRFFFVFADPAGALRNAQQLRTSDKVRRRRQGEKAPTTIGRQGTEVRQRRQGARCPPCS